MNPGGLMRHISLTGCYPQVDGQNSNSDDGDDLTPPETHQPSGTCKSQHLYKCVMIHKTAVTFYSGGISVPARSELTGKTLAAFDKYVSNVEKNNSKNQKIKMKQIEQIEPIETSDVYKSSNLMQLIAHGGNSRCYFPNFDTPNLETFKQKKQLYVFE